MFLDEPKKEAYQEGMSLEQFVEASATDEVKTLLSGKVPEMAVEGIALDTSAFETFQQNMLACAQRVAVEKKNFQSAKKWLNDQFEAEVSRDRATAKRAADKKEKNKKRLLEVLFTLLLIGVFALFFWYAKVYLPENPMTALRVFSSGWLKALSIIFTILCFFFTWYSASNTQYKGVGQMVRFITSMTGVVSTIFLFISLNTVATGTYDISTAQELKTAGNFPVGSSFTLRGDVDMEGAKMKHLFRTFEGTFEGNGYTISGIELKATNKAGLFRTNNGTIQNLTVSNITVNWKAKKNYSGSHYNFQVGVLVSYNDYAGSVQFCTVKDSKFVLQGNQPSGAQATAYQYTSSSNCMGAVIGHNSYTGFYSGLTFENVTADYYMVHSAISGPYMPYAGYNSNQ